MTIDGTASAPRCICNESTSVTPFCPVHSPGMTDLMVPPETLDDYLAANPPPEPEVWKQERPRWCPHTDCSFRRRAQDALCGGELPEPADHDGTPNTHRVCMNGAADDGGVLDLQVNGTDLNYFRWIFDALDGQITSWLSRRAKGGTP